MGIDILLEEADGTSPVLLHQQLQRDFELQIDFSGLAPEIKDTDSILAQVLDANPAVQGCFFRFDDQSGNARDFPGPGIAKSGLPGSLPARTKIPTAVSISLPLPKFATHTRGPLHPACRKGTRVV